MSWKSPGMVALMTNLLRPEECTIYAAGTSSTQTGYEAANAMDYQLAPPVKFVTTLGNVKSIEFDLGTTARTIEAVAIIDAHSGLTANIGDEDFETELQFELVYVKSDNTTATAQAYCYVPGNLQDMWGPSIMIELNQAIAAKRLKVNMKSTSGADLGAATIGAVLAGRKYSLPSNPLIPQGWTEITGSAYLGGVSDPVVTGRYGPRRAVTSRWRFADDDARLGFQRLVAGRGRRRGGANSDMGRRRLDLPTALILPDMWVGSNNYGAAVYGMFTGGTAAQLGIGGTALVDATFEEIV